MPLGGIFDKDIVPHLMKKSKEGMIKREKTEKIFKKIEKKQKNFQKPIAFLKKMWYNIKVERQGPLVKRLRRRPLTAKIWVRFP